MCVGTDPETRRQRWLTKTVHGSARYARAPAREQDHLRRHRRPLRLPDAVGRGARTALAPGSVARVHGVLHHAFAQAVRWDWVFTNPASGVTPPRVPPADIRPPSPAQVAALLEWTSQNKPALFCFLRLAVSAGARRSQLLAVRWCDVDEDRGAIAFTRGLVVGPKGLELRATKKQESLASLHHFESKVGRSRSLERTCPPQLDPSGTEILEESNAAAEQDGDEVDLHLVQ